MELDVSSTDRFDRLLRYVYVDDEMVNATLISGGFAVASAFPPDTKFADRFENIQIQAMENRRGAWATSPALAEACDPSYPTICVPQDAEPMTCKEIPSNPFPVLHPDAHSFILTAIGWVVTGKRPNTCTIIEPPLCMKSLPSTMTAP